MLLRMVKREQLARRALMNAFQANEAANPRRLQGGAVQHPVEKAIINHGCLTDRGN